MHLEAWKRKDWDSLAKEASFPEDQIIKCTLDLTNFSTFLSSFAENSKYSSYLKEHYIPVDKTTLDGFDEIVEKMGQFDVKVPAGLGLLLQQERKEGCEELKAKQYDKEALSQWIKEKVTGTSKCYQDWKSHASSSSGARARQKTQPTSASSTTAPQSTAQQHTQPTQSSTLPKSDVEEVLQYVRKGGGRAMTDEEKERAKRVLSSWCSQELGVTRNDISAVDSGMSSGLVAAAA
nr:uncharacterized protein CI109_005427 [Kwoniella shandongensis]KAA5526303.1 hypothetical protein CI109_005427 [Kwoniella shandongensis]